MRMLILFCLMAVVASKVTFHECNDEPQNACQISEVRITSCQKYNARWGCVLKKGVNSTLSFDFIPRFNAASLTAGIYYKHHTISEMIIGGSTDGCTMTTCPVKAGKQQEFTFNVHIGSDLPLGTATTKWKIWNAENQSQVCCLLTKATLIN